MLDRYRMLLAVTITALLIVGASGFAVGQGKDSTRLARGTSGDRVTQSGANAREARKASPRLRRHGFRARRAKRGDRSAPDTVIDSGPSGMITARSASFGVSATEGNSTFECSFDGAAWSRCASPTAYSELADGPHTFSVRATDAAGNVDRSPAVRSFTVSASADTTAPDTSITTGPSGTITTSSASFAFSASESGSTYECRLDSAAWGACTSRKSYSSLSQGAHSFAVRATDRASNTDLSPASLAFTVDVRATGAGSVVPGTGTVLSQDLATVANPCTLWGHTMDPHLNGCDSRGASDPYIVRREGDGDPHVPIGAGAPNATYRRYISKAGVPSLYDAGVGNGSTRTQTEKWSTSGNQMSFGPGTYAFYVSFRLQELADGSSPFPYPQAHGGGNTKYSQLLQFKSFGNGLSTHLPLWASIGSDGIKFIANDGSEVLQRILRVPTGEWIRMAVVANWDSDGWYEVWADVDGDGSMTRVLDRQSGIDFMAGRTHSAMGLGPYHRMSLFDGTVAGQPRQETVYTDYANAQIANWSQP